MKNVDVNNVFLQHYGATCHTVRVLLHEKFPGSDMTLNGDVKWPGCDLKTTFWTYSCGVMGNRTLIERSVTFITRTIEIRVCLKEWLDNEFQKPV